MEVCPATLAGTEGGGGLAPLQRLSTLPPATPDPIPGASLQEIAGAANGGPEPDARGGEASLPHGVSAAVGEWKLVTVLCCAVAALPPAAPQETEPHYRALHALAVLAEAAVQRYGGTLQPVVGDHLIALFGAPRAQEDHARYAVLAALDLQQRLRQPPTPDLPALGAGLAVRMGVHSGLWSWARSGPPFTGR